MYQYDILKETWIYAEIKQQTQEEEHLIYMQEYQQMLQSIVQARFPRLAGLTKEVISQVIDSVVLRDLIVQVSTAKVEKVARQYLNEQKQQSINEQKGNGSGEAT